MRPGFEPWFGTSFIFCFWFFSFWHNLNKNPRGSLNQIPATTTLVNFTTGFECLSSSTSYQKKIHLNSQTSNNNITMKSTIITQNNSLTNSDKWFKRSSSRATKSMHHSRSINLIAAVPTNKPQDGLLTSTRQVFSTKLKVILTNLLKGLSKSTNS